MIIDKNFYPGWVRKSVSFTIDDGNNPLDKKFISIVKPAGLKGTFNPCGEEPSPIPEYPEMYDGFEISNHCSHHPGLFTDEMKKCLSEKPLVRGEEGVGYVYRAEEDGFYYDKRTSYTMCAADEEHYIMCALQAEEELVRVFGRDRVRGFVWPFSRQGDDAFLKKLVAAGHFESVRGTMMPEGKEKFSLPKNRFDWCFNGECFNLLESAAEYDSLPDDGELKYYCFGVHSHDFENSGRWNVLEEFCRKYGGRSDFYYCTIHDVFDIQDAVAALEITDMYIYNPSDIDVYVKIDGRKEIIKSNTMYKF